MFTPVVANPCRGICQFNSKLDLCVGCYRKAEERATWYGMNEADQRQLLDVLALRKARFGKLIPGSN